VRVLQGALAFATYLLVSSVLVFSIVEWKSEAVAISSLAVLILYSGFLLIVSDSRLISILLSPTKLEASFGDGVNNVESKAKQIVGDEDKEKARRAVEKVESETRDPELAFLIVIGEVERRVGNAYEAVFHQNPGRRPMVYMLSRLAESNALDRRLVSLIEEFIDLRNALIHGRSSAKETDLWRGIEIGEAIISKLDKAMDSTK